MRLPSGAFWRARLALGQIGPECVIQECGRIDADSIYFPLSSIGALKLFDRQTPR